MLETLARAVPAPMRRLGAALYGCVDASLPPCSVEQVRRRLVMTMVAMGVVFFCVRLCAYSVSTAPRQLNLWMDVAALIVHSGAFSMLERDVIDAATVGDVAVWMFAAMYAMNVFVIEEHMFSLISFASTILPVLASFIATRKTAARIIAFMTFMYIVAFCKSADRPARTLQLTDVDGLFTLLGTVVCISLLAQIYVSHVQRNFDAMVQTTGTVEQANMTKTMFIANISHELRTPLHAILAAASFLKSADLSSESHMFVNTILTCSDTIKSLVGNILDLSRIEADILEWNCQTFDLLGLVEEVVDGMAVFAHNKGIRLHLRCPIAPPFRWQYIYSDRIRLKKIVGNLVDNAIKFCNVGRVDVRVTCVGYYVSASVNSDELHPMSSMRKTPATVVSELFPNYHRDFVPPNSPLRRQPYAARIRFEVSDTGIGIAPHYLPDVFEPFSQPLRLKEGPGLGLCVSQRLALGLGGRIHVESKQNEGSRFWFELVVPVTPCVEQQHAKEAVMPLAEGDVNMSSSSRSSSGTMPGGRSAVCSRLLSDLHERRTLGRFYFCRELTPCAEDLLEELDLCGFATCKIAKRELLALLKSRHQPHTSNGAGTIDLSVERATQALHELDVVVIDEQLMTLEEVLPWLQSQTFNGKSFCPVVVFLALMGQEDMVLRTLNQQQQQRLLIISKPAGPINLLQSLNRLIDMVMQYYENVAERPRRLLLPRPTMNRTASVAGTASWAAHASRAGAPGGSVAMSPRRVAHDHPSVVSSASFTLSHAPVRAAAIARSKSDQTQATPGASFRGRRPAPVLAPIPEHPDEHQPLTPLSPVHEESPATPATPATPASPPEQEYGGTKTPVEHEHRLKGEPTAHDEGEHNGEHNGEQSRGPNEIDDITPAGPSEAAEHSDDGEHGDDEEDDDDLSMDQTSLSHRLIGVPTAAMAAHPDVSASLRGERSLSIETASETVLSGEGRKQPLPILVVEDNPINQMIMKHLITKKMGLECEVCSRTRGAAETNARAQIVDNGRKALEAWSERDFSLIFMDIQMPVMDGLTAMREIRRLERLEGRKRVWIVAMTGLAFMEDRDAAVEAGCDEFLSKPVDMEMLQNRVLVWLAESSASPATALGPPGGSGA